MAISSGGGAARHKRGKREARCKPAPRRQATRQRSAALRDLVDEDALAERRRTREAAAAQERRLAELSDAATSAEHAADVLVDMFGEGVAPPGVLELLGPEDRARAVVTALSAARPGSLCALTLAAEVAGMVDGQLTRAAELLRLAIPMTDDPVELHRIAYHLARLGCVREALDMVEPHLTEDPREPEAAATYALALGVARLTFATPIEGPCPCGSDDEWVQCCRAAEATALDRFLDRNRFDTLLTSVAAYVDAGPCGEAVRQEVARAMSGLRADPAESDALGRLVTENAWLGQSVLTAFADDPATPAELAETARRWQYDVAFGLWQIADPVPSPGVWCTDIVTGERRYAAIPSHHLSDVHRWGVLLCALVADHGVWRTTGAVLVLRPAEADMLAESVNDGLVDLLHDKGIPYPGGKGQELPPSGVVAGGREPISAEGVRAFSAMMGAGLPAMAKDLRTLRNSLQTSDREDMCLVSVEIELQHRAETLRRFREHPSAEPASSELIVWRGARMTRPERARIGADVRADLGDDGGIASDPKYRWMLGYVEVRDDLIRLETDSRERFTAFLDLLRELGDEPRVLQETKWAPSAYLWHLGGGRSLSLCQNDQLLDAWERNWPDERLPALEGRTPRQACRRQTLVLKVEALLRELENEADQLARIGRPAPDVDFLRGEIGLRGVRAHPAA